MTKMKKKWIRQDHHSHHGVSQPVIQFQVTYFVPLFQNQKNQFIAWSNSSTSSSNAKTDNQTSGDGWANFDDADFGQPDRSSSPESGKNSEKMETDTFSTPANNTEGKWELFRNHYVITTLYNYVIKKDHSGNGDTSKPSNPAE